ncbi:acylphosphatase [Sunxiuqinia sp. A32]|uniref:acylphosphatase n=1 Tax=Sunxiuqinia sp. A32 TaxID=3461496 RepID=UPI00404678D7
MNPNKTFHIIIYGRVQGVGFRYFVRQKAMELELTGWVKNCPNRTVEIEAQGDQQQLETFLDFLRIGNGYSRTDKLNYTEVTTSKTHHSFQVKY